MSGAGPPSTGWRATTQPAVSPACRSTLASSPRVCPDCHRDEHLVWRCAGLDDRAPRPALLLRRLAAWLGRWGRSLEPAHVVAVAEVAADLAERIEEEG